MDCGENCPANQERLLKDGTKKVSKWKNILLTVPGSRSRKKKKDHKDLVGKHGNPGSVN